MGGEESFPNYAGMTDDERKEFAQLFADWLAALEKTYKDSSPIIRRSAWDCAVAEYRIRLGNRRETERASRAMAFPFEFVPGEEWRDDD